MCGIPDIDRNWVNLFTLSTKIDPKATIKSKCNRYINVSKLKIDGISEDKNIVPSLLL